MIISVASGKGGTGKTTIAVNLALVLAKDKEKNVQFLDCDVEEPNAHLFLKPVIISSESVKIPVPKINDKKCNYCGKCAEVCVFNAIAVTKNKVLVFPGLCHGCGACTLFCPERAITEKGNEVGVLEEGKAGSINFVHGRLNIGEPMAPPIIREIKKRINKDGIKGGNNDITNNYLTLIDAPPGTSCPVIESIKYSDYTILVTEPTPFGLHDLILAVEVLKKLKIPHGVVLNKYDFGDHKVEKYCKKNNIPLLLFIPMDKDIAVAYSQGIPIVKINPSYEQKFIQLFQRIIQSI
ncbi:MAG: Iron-sulfur cluster-binding/ATPase domain protein [Parcubacteria bacterium 32_520]|nr:MAG: Iron-sulfur cluster-binding/ATPase domain protein [Parcubacteria bacterium 32_520]